MEPLSLDATDHQTMSLLGLLGKTASVVMPVIAYHNTKILCGKILLFLIRNWVKTQDCLCYTCKLRM